MTWIDWIDGHGNKARIAEHLGISRAAVSMWKNKRPPVERVNDVASFTGIPREDIRPDIFGPVQ